MAKRNFIKDMKGKDLFLLCVAVFMMFGTIGPGSALATGVLQTVSWTYVIVATLSSGLLAAAIVLAMKRPVTLVVVIPIFLLINLNSVEIARFISGRYEPVPTSIKEATSITPEQFQKVMDTRIGFFVLSGALMAFGYAMFITVLSVEGGKRWRMESEVKIAQDIQKSLLPSNQLQLPWCSVNGLTVPTSEVGGDYFDWVSISGDRVGVIVADVSGHGTGAGIIAAMTKSAFYMQMAEDPSPAIVMTQINNALAQITDRKTFVTCAYLLLDLNQRGVRFITAGHPPILFKSTSHEIKELYTHNLALGFKRDIKFNEGKQSWHHGDSILLYTDGITDARDKSGTSLGHEGIKRLFGQVVDPGTTCGQILSSLETFAGKKEFPDDVTAVCVGLRQFNPINKFSPRP